MITHEAYRRDTNEPFAVINACYTLTEEYRGLMNDMAKMHQLTENEMLVLIHLAQYPKARTQKQLRDTNLPLSVSSICRMVDGLRRKGYLTTELDENDRRSWIIHLEEKGFELAADFRTCLSQRLKDIFSRVPGIDYSEFLTVMTKASAAAARPIPSRMAV